MSTVLIVAAAVAGWIGIALPLGCLVGRVLATTDQEREDYAVNALVDD